MKPILVLISVIFLLSACKKEEECVPEETILSMNSYSASNQFEVPFKGDITIEIEDCSHIDYFNNNVGTTINCGTGTYVFRRYYVNQGDKVYFVSPCFNPLIKYTPDCN